MRHIASLKKIGYRLQLATKMRGLSLQSDTKKAPRVCQILPLKKRPFAGQSGTKKGGKVRYSSVLKKGILLTSVYAGSSVFKCHIDTTLPTPVFSVSSHSQLIEFKGRIFR